MNESAKSMIRLLFSVFHMLRTRAATHDTDFTDGWSTAIVHGDRFGSTEPVAEPAPAGRIDPYGRQPKHLSSADQRKAFHEN